MILQDIAAIGKREGISSPTYTPPNVFLLTLKIYILGVASYEIPRGVVLDTQNFTEENQRMTASNKICRRVIADVRMMLNTLFP